IGCEQISERKAATTTARSQRPLGSQTGWALVWIGLRIAESGSREAAPDQAVTGALTSGSGSQDRRVSPSATITAGPVSRLAVALGTTVSLPPGTSTVHRLPSPSPGQPPVVAAAATAAATAPVPQDSVSPDPRSWTRISIACSPVIRSSSTLTPPGNAS